MNFEKVFKIYFFDHLQKISKQIPNQAIRIKPKIFTQNYKMRRHCSKPLQETAHKIWLILKPKTYCFPLTRYWLARLAQPPPVYIVKIQPKNSNNTLERLSKENHILPKTKLNLHILSFRRPSSSARRLRLGFTQKLPQKPAKSKNTMQKLLRTGRPACVLRKIFLLFHNFPNAESELTSK